MYKNICRVPAYFDGKKGYTLLGPDGRELLEARHFCRVMIIDQGKSSHTISNYMFRLGHFLDFLFEAIALVGRNPLKNRNPILQLADLFDHPVRIGIGEAAFIAIFISNDPMLCPIFSAQHSRDGHDQDDRQKARP